MALREDNPNHLLIGLGGTGGLILKAFKKRLYKEFPIDKKRNEMKPAVEFLYVDSTRDDLMNDKREDSSWKVMGNDVTFTDKEFFNIKSDGTSLTRILTNISNYPGLKYVVKNGAAMQQTIGDIQKAAGQKRRAGRIMFASNCAQFLQAVARHYENLKNRTGYESLHLHIFTGLAGGTGSGSIIDVIAQLRKKYPSAEIDVYAMVPERDIPNGLQAGRYHQNGYAALAELSAFNAAGRFLPSDVLTGEEHIQLPADSKKYFGLMLFNDVNSNGMVLKSREILPELVADALFIRLFLPNNNNNKDIFKAWSCENFEGFEVEYSEKSKKGDLEPARTKAVATFGIKRIVYPETRIQEHVTYTIALKIILQMQYNHFKEKIGYIDEAEKKDYTEFTKNEGKLKKWLLDEKHLTLDERILATDKDVQSFDVFWGNQVNFYTYDEAKSNSSEPLQELEILCQESYEKDFRLKQGVVDYFKDKSADRALREQAQYIVDSIEKELYTSWYEGRYSIYDLKNIAEVILDYISKLTNGIEAKLAEIDKNIDSLEEAKTKNSYIFNHLDILDRILGKSSKTYADHQAILKELYVQKTLLIAKQFETDLLLRLHSEFEDFANGLNSFVGALVKKQKELIQKVTDRTRQDSNLDMKNTTIEISEDYKMYVFEEKLCKDKSKIDKLASILRKKIVEEQLYAHFSDLAKKIGEDRIRIVDPINNSDGFHSVADIADQFLTPQIIDYQNSDEDYRRNIIMGINVLDQLQRLIQTNTLGMDLQTFAREVTQYSGVFLKLNSNELNRTLRNNPSPTVDPHSMHRKVILICLPKSDGDVNLKLFSQNLTTALSESFNAATPVVIDDSSPRKNEISILEIENCFPIRGLDFLPYFRQEYERLVNDPNEAERKQNRILLHIEGDGTEIPPLECEGEGPIGNDLLSYFFLAAATNKLKVDKDELENEGWCYVTADEWGTEVKTIICRNFTEIVTSEELTPEIKEAIIDEVDEMLKDLRNLKVSEKEALANNIINVMKDYVSKECSGPKSPKYIEYGNAAKAAIKKIKG